MAKLLSLFILLSSAAYSFANVCGSTEARCPCAFIDTINITGSYFYDFDPNSPKFSNETLENNIKNTTTNNNINNNSNNNNITTISTIKTKNLKNLENLENFQNSKIAGEYKNYYYIHDWMLIPFDFVDVYDFIIKNGVRVPAERHLRACICRIKPCIRFCCAQGHYYDVTNNTCNKMALNEINEALNQTTMLVRSVYNNSNNNNSNSNINNNKNNNNNNNNLQRRVRTDEIFIVNLGTPCERMRTAFKDEKELVTWTLFENGTIAYKNYRFSKHYCYTPFRLANKTWLWQPLTCVTEKMPFILGVREWTYVVCLILSIICMGIIFLIHLLCIEVRNTFYGVAIKAFTMCIIFGYSLMIHLMLNEPSKMSKAACVIIPSFILLFMLLSIYVLTFISFNFYLNFHGVILTKTMFWLIFFPINLALAIGWALFVANSKYAGKSVFGGETCWFDPRNWAIMVYYNAPIFVAFVFSIFFYILTQIRIAERHESDNKATTLEENRYKSFQKFFSYTFIMWLICVVSFIINHHRKVSERAHVNYVTCLAVALHGFGSLYALIGKNQQIQNFLKRIEDSDDEEDDEICELRPNALPLTSTKRC